MTTQGVTEPVQLKRVTTEFDEHEDRLRLAGETEHGEPVVLWLTQRLLKRVVPHVLAWLQPPGQSAKSVPDYHIEAVQSFAQQAAVAQLELQPPVVVQQPTAASQSLVDTVEITRTPEVIALTFKVGENKAVLLLAPHSLRQWLSIVCQLCRKAEWGMDSVWPEWMISSVAAPMGPVKAVMH